MASAKESRTKKESNPKSIKEKEGISGWTLFVTIVIIINAIYVGWLIFKEPVNGLLIGDLLSIAVLTLPFPVVLIDFIAVLFYVIKKKPRGGIGLLSLIALLIFGMLLASHFRYML